MYRKWNFLMVIAIVIFCFAVQAENGDVNVTENGLIITDMNEAQEKQDEIIIDEANDGNQIEPANGAVPSDANVQILSSDTNTPETAVYSELQRRMQKRISVDFRDTQINDVIRIMAEQADVDIVSSPNVTGTVTAKLRNVPLEEALRNILAANGYGYVASNNMIRVAPVAELTSVAERLVDRIFKITYADVVEVEKALQKYISARGSITSNPGTNHIIITDSESKIDNIAKFIEEIDKMTSQVLVEVAIYDVTSKDRLDLGVQWIAAGNNVNFVDGVPVGDTNPYTQGRFVSPTDKASQSENQIRFGIINDSLNLQTILSAEQESLSATLLANPRILVLDNHKATFKSVSEIPYQELNETSAGGQIGTTDFREVGVSLDVTPHVARDGMVRIRVQPEFSVVTGQVTLGAFAVQAPQPVVDRRTGDTTLLVREGQTIVLGGLRKKEITEQTNKVPLLGDIPLLGWLFRFKGEEVINSELVVFITPHIVNESVMTGKEQSQFDYTNEQMCDPAPGEVLTDRCEVQTGY